MKKKPKDMLLLEHLIYMGFFIDKNYFNMDPMSLLELKRVVYI